MLIKNDKEFAQHLGVTEDQLKECFLDCADYATTVSSDGYTVRIRMCETDLPSDSKIITYPFTDDEFDEALSDLQCFADYLAHEAKGKHGSYDESYGDVNYDEPPLLEDEIAEILNERKGQGICIMKSPMIMSKYWYDDYETGKGIVFLIYDALLRHYFVTVGGKNIIDM